MKSFYSGEILWCISQDIHKNFTTFHVGKPLSKMHLNHKTTFESQIINITDEKMSTLPTALWIMRLSNQSGKKEMT